MPRDSWLLKHKEVHSELVPDDEVVRSELRQYMLNHFFRDAPIPKVQALADGPTQVQDFLRMELEAYFNSGLSMTFRHKESRELVGAMLFLLWGRDDNYEVLEGDAIEWHNAAASLAEEFSREADPRITWRDFQYQHIYNLAQRLLLEHPSKKGFVWAGPLSFMPEVRDLGLSEAIISNSVKVTDEQGLLLGTQTTFRGFEKFLQNQFNNYVVVNEARYEEEDLVVGGEAVLHKLAKLGDMKFIVNLPLK